MLIGHKRQEVFLREGHGSDSKDNKGPVEVKIGDAIAKNRTLNVGLRFTFTEIMYQFYLGQKRRYRLGG